MALILGTKCRVRSLSCEKQGLQPKLLPREAPREALRIPGSRGLPSRLLGGVGVLQRFDREFLLNTSKFLGLVEQADIFSRPREHAHNAANLAKRRLFPSRAVQWQL